MLLRLLNPDQESQTKQWDARDYMFIQMYTDTLIIIL